MSFLINLKMAKVIESESAAQIAVLTSWVKLKTTKKTIEGRIEFKDLIGSMMNLNQMSFEDSDEDDLNEDDYK